MRHGPILGCIAIVAAGCGDPDIGDDWTDEPDSDPDGYVMLDRRAREKELSIRVTGSCLPWNQELPRWVSSNESAVAVSWHDDAPIPFIWLDVVPGQVLVVYGLDEPTETFEIDPDRASIQAVRPSAVAELAAMVYADTITRDGEAVPDSWYPPIYGLHGRAVWENLNQAELPEGILSIHPVPLQPARSGYGLDAPEILNEEYDHWEIPISELMNDPAGFEEDDDLMELEEEG